GSLHGLLASPLPARVLIDTDWLRCRPKTPKPGAPRQPNAVLLPGTRDTVGRSTSGSTGWRTRSEPVPLEPLRLDTQRTSSPLWVATIATIASRPGVRAAAPN